MTFIGYIFLCFNFLWWDMMKAVTKCANRDVDIQLFWAFESRHRVRPFRMALRSFFNNTWWSSTYVSSFYRLFSGWLNLFDNRTLLFTCSLPEIQALWVKFFFTLRHSYTYFEDLPYLTSRFFQSTLWFVLILTNGIDLSSNNWQDR